MQLFDLDPEITYLNHAAVAPWPSVTEQAVRQFAEENRRWGATHYPRWLETERRLRVSLAALINAPSADDIGLLKNTSEGLSTVAYGLSWQAGDNIVSIVQEFPSNRIVWESLKAQGVELRLLDLDNSHSPESDLIALCDAHTKLISVSSVQYASGLRLELDLIGRYCRNHGVLFCVDAIQSLGALSFDVTQNLADFVVADGHKWLLSAEGIALFYCRPALRERLKLQQYGWHMIEQMGDFDRKAWTVANSARRFECGSPNMLGIHALEASLGLIMQQGVNWIQQRILQNTQCMIEEVDRLGLELLTPRAEQRRSGIVTFRAPARDNQQLHNHLTHQGVVCALRGGGIRFSPHFYNEQHEIRAAFDKVSSYLR
jgi:selenocysteine lyase/cysteine desulfurase